MTWMTRIALGLASLTLASVTWAEPPTDVWALDYRTKGSQFELKTKRGSTPTIEASLLLGTNAWPAAGWTVRFRYWQSDRSEALVTIPGSVSGNTVTFQGGTNDFATELRGGYGAVVVSSGALVVCFADGVVDVLPGPEIGVTNRVSPTIGIYGPDYGPFTGDFSHWPLGGKSWLETTNWVTSWVLGLGYVGESVTNGLWNRTDGTNWTDGNYYPRNNPSNWVSASVTNGLVPEAPLTTSQYARSNGQWVVVSATGGGTGDVSRAYVDAADAQLYPRSNPSNWVPASVTNGLYPASNPSNWVTEAVTNGLYPASNPSNWVTEAVTNGLATMPDVTNSVTYETLNANGDVGTASTQVSRGNHGHSTYVQSLASASSTTNGASRSGTVGTVYFKTNLFAGASTTGDVTSAVADAGKFLMADGTWQTAGTGDLSKATADLTYYPVSNPSNHVGGLSSNTTYTLTNTMTTAEIQATISAVPKCLGGFNVYFVFSPGTYSLTTNLVVEGFYAGFVYLQSAANTLTLHSNQTSIIDVGTSGTYVFLVQNNAAAVLFQDLKITVTTDALRYGVYGSNNSRVVLNGCWLSGSSTGNGYLLYMATTRASTLNTYYSNCAYAIVATSASSYYVLNCGRTGTSPATGCYGYGGLMHRGDTNVVGTTDNAVDVGGVIITKAGLIHP